MSSKKCKFLSSLGYSVAYFFFFFGLAFFALGCFIPHDFVPHAMGPPPPFLFNQLLI